MNIKIICKASRTEGLGHLFRSLSLAQFIFDHKANWNIEFVVISELILNHILNNHNLSFIQIPDESSLETLDPNDVLILDMLSLKNAVFNKIKKSSKKTICISPIFNQMENCDILITRTKYFNKGWSDKLEVKAGLDFSIIRPDCQQIKTSHYRDILDYPTSHIAISMGGTDQHNLTFEILKNLTSFKGRALFWVILGEGYSHNYHELVKVIKENSRHEIILARTNQSMWNIMSNCSVAILAGGITSYEAAYAGLPAINYFHSAGKSFLTEELVENNLCLKNCFTIEAAISQLDQCYSNKQDLLDIHLSCKETFTTNPIKNILGVLDQIIEKK